MSGLCKRGMGEPAMAVLGATIFGELLRGLIHTVPTERARMGAAPNGIGQLIGHIAHSRIQQTRRKQTR